MIYFVKSGDYVKIGYTDKLHQRLSALKTDSPIPIEILGVMNGGRDAEGILHFAFQAFRYTGEWFKINPELLDYIEKNATPYTYDPVEYNKHSSELRNARLEAGYTQSDVAHKLGMSQQSLAKMEVAYSEGRLKIDQIKRYLGAFDYDIKFIKKEKTA